MPVSPPFLNIASIPIDKHFDTTVNEALLGFHQPFNKKAATIGKTIQSGVVRLKVLINRTCPFRKSPLADYALVFNDRTIAKFPNFITDKIRGAKGVGGPDGGDSFTLEGVSLLPRYVYRHNFLRLLHFPATSFTSAVNVNLQATDATVTETPRYEENTTWARLDSVFAGTVTPTAATAGCNEQPDFRYSAETLPVSYDYKDINLDYGVESNFEKAKKNLNLATVQAIHMHKSQTCAREGIHWRLQTVEKAFTGQDFFFRFFKKTESPDLPGGDLSPRGFSQSAGLAGQSYEYLDATRNFATTGGKPPANQAVAAYTVDPENHNTTKADGYDGFVLSNQPYVIIEMGTANPVITPGSNDNVGQHYFIIITARSHPIFVLEENRITYVLSVYTPMRGKDLLGQNFTITVRHWLGKMVVTFDGDGAAGSSPLWIVERKKEEVEEGNSYSSTNVMAVTEAPLSLWGGNFQTAFIYGPLQYQNKFSFNLPPKSPASHARPPSTTLGISKVACATFQGLSLPLPETAHRLTFSVTDAPIEDLPGTSGPLYTCDAQQIRDYTYLTGDVATGLSPPVHGNFYHKPNYRAPGPVLSELNVQKVIKCEDEARRNQKFIARINFICGSHKFANSGWELNACKNPILTTLRLIADDPIQESQWDTSATCRDVTDHVLDYDEAWVAQDFHSIEHSGNITFLLHGNPLNVLPETSFLEGLKNKAFYIEVWAGYVDCNYPKLPNGSYWKLFTGICEGGTVEVAPGRKVMKCQINDYTKALADQRLFNSPFFDGVIDAFAIHELLAMAGFRDGGGTPFLDEAPRQPAGLLKDITRQSQGDEAKWIFGDGRSGTSKLYALPSGYSRIQDPKFKFSDTSPILDAIKRIAKTAGKLFFFDQHGLAHYENYFDEVIETLTPGADVTKLVASTPFWFTTNPLFSPGQLVFNQASRYFNVADVHNQIRVFGNTPNFDPTWHDDINWASLDSIDTEGFLGYKRIYYQEEGAFGSDQAARNIVTFYRALFRPPIVVKFETYGLPTRALDLIVFDKEIFRVMRVSSTIDASKNVWWQEYECEWFQSAETTTGVSP